MKRSEQGFTLVEIMIVVAIIALLAAIAIPNVLRGRTTANESAAIGNLRALISSLEMVRSVNQVYPDQTVATLDFRDTLYGVDGAPCVAGGAPNPDFGPPSFCLALTGGGAANTVQGFVYTYANGATIGQTYTVLATPGTLGTTGTRSFVANETGLVRHCTGTGTAANMLDATPAPTIDVAVIACD